METIILCVLSLIVGWKLGSLWNVIAFKKLLEDLGVTSQQLTQLKDRLEAGVPDLADDTTEQPQTVVEVRLEQHQGTILAYRKDNDQFIGQGPDRESLIQRLTENLTPCRVVIAKEDGADLISP
jgi:hypothetical protein